MPLFSKLANIGLIKRRKPSPFMEVLRQPESLAIRTVPTKRLTFLAQPQRLIRKSRLTLIKKRTERPLVEVLLNKKVKPTLIIPIKQPGFLAGTRQLFHNLFGDTREQYQQSLNTNYDSSLEVLTKQLKLSIVVSLIGLGLATAGVFVSPLFYWPTIVCIVYSWWPVFPRIYHIYVEEGRLDYRTLYVFLLLTALAGGFIWATAFGAVFGVFSHYLLLVTENRSKQRISDLFGGQIRTVWRLVDGVEIETAIEQICEGDIVVVQAGQMIPVDGLIATGNATIDQHMLTGEAQPVEKGEGDTVLAATVVLTGRLYIRVEKAGQMTVATQITHMLSQTSDFKRLLQSRSDRFLNRIALPILGLSAFTLPVAGVSGAVSILWYYPGSRMVIFGPLSMLSYLQVAAQKEILIKDGRALEVLTEVDTIVFDKTGTLTQEQPTVSHIHSYSGLTEMALLRYAAAAEIKQSHPIARAIVQAATEQGLDLPSLAEAEYKVGYGLKVELESQTVWVGSLRFMRLEGVTVPEEVTGHQAMSHAQGHSLVLVAVDGEVVGAIELQPTIRPEAREIINNLQARGLKTVIISGDNEGPTRQMAAELGINRYFAEVLPQDKAKLVEQLQEEGHKVCFVGDGINDSIALRTANVSVSLRGATTIATDMAQIVFMNGTLAQLPVLFDLADEFLGNLRWNILVATLPNVVGIAGTLLLGWGFTLCVVLLQVSIPFGIYNSLKPLWNTDNSQFLPQRDQGEA